LTFIYHDTPHSTELYVGSIDEDILLGKKTGKEEYIGESGPRSLRDDGGCGTLLANTTRSGHIWVENAIPGLTDMLPGLKHWRDRSDGVGWEKEEDLRKPSLTNAN
jgi:hypothetical protein